MENHAHPTISARIDDAWLDYGEIDPLEQPEQLLHRCRSCRAAPSLAEGPANKWGRPTVVASCACGAAGPTSDQAYGAVLAWNMRPDLAIAPSYRELPFFGLADLSPIDALRRLRVLRAHLDGRLDAAERRIESGLPSGKLYRHRLRAYRGWCVHAIKRAEVALQRVKQ